MDTQVTTKFKIFKTVNEVFEAIIDPEKMSNYWFSWGTGRMEQGKTITWRYDEYNAEVDIHVLEVVNNRNNRTIIFSWGGSDQETVVTITLTELEPASTVIEVIESGLRENDPEIVNKMIDQKEG
ncbi:SRPBCC domain-containing protein [Paenibacillus sp.]|uniref:SRPBCC domain-containing protein n=1 Tax=Paenibacillus sp. TaxID=58172 RepID=UPI0037CB566E